MSVTFIITFLFCAFFQQNLYTITQQVTNNNDDDSYGGGDNGGDER